MEGRIADVYPMEDPGFVQPFLVNEAPREGSVASKQFGNTGKVVINYGGKKGVHGCGARAAAPMLPNV